MNIGWACAIFKQIESYEYTDVEKYAAIYHVMQMATHNSITKDNMLTVIRYLFNKQHDVTKEGDDNEYN